MKGGTRMGSGVCRLRGTAREAWRPKPEGPRKTGLGGYGGAGWGW